MLHISIAAEQIFPLFGISITNSFFTTWIVMALLIILSVVLTSKLKRKPGLVQVAAELIIGGLYSFMAGLGGKHGKVFAPIAVTMFLFILISNWSGLIPGVGTVGFYENGAEETSKIVTTVKAESASDAAVTTEKSTTTEKKPEAKVFVPFFRAPTADLNTTLALALIAFCLIQYYGLKYGGIGYLKKFVNISNPIGFFVGILETVSDISKIISFAFRLFGNIFAGEVLLGVMGFLFAFFLPIPFYGLELFVGLIQALVFAMLTMVFINLAVSHGEHEGHAEAHS